MTQRFIRYIESKGLKFIRGTESDTSIFAEVSGQPNLSNFTQMYKMMNGHWKVRLSKKDVENVLITNGEMGEKELIEPIYHIDIAGTRTMED